MVFPPCPRVLRTIVGAQGSLGVGEGEEANPGEKGHFYGFHTVYLPSDTAARMIPVL